MTTVCVQENAMAVDSKISSQHLYLQNGYIGFDVMKNIAKLVSYEEAND